MNFQKFNQYEAKELIEIYEALVRPRMIEEKMLKLLRQGQVSKWFSGIGQEAIAVGATLALEKDEYIMPNHRNLGVFTTREIPLDKLLYQWRGDFRGFTKGRDRSFHFGTNEYHIAGMISHLGSMLSVADGVALANKLKGRRKVTLAFSGDGGTSEGEFHEALNLAAVWDLPVIFLIENNGYGLSTPSAEQFKCKSLADKGIGYGIESKTIDGNNVLEVYSTVQSIAKDLRHNPRPFLLECRTFRMRGHEEASGVKYVPKELLELWSQKDPVNLFRNYLIENQQVKDILLIEIENKVADDISKAVRVFDESVEIKIDREFELSDVFMSSPNVTIEPTDGTSNIRFIDAISDGLKIAMRKYPNLVLMGQDIAEYGGVFKITDGFVSEFGKDRVRNTPISEAAPLGAGLGLSIGGMKAMIEMQFADFVSCGFNQIVNNLAKSYYRWGQQSDVVIRMPTGGGVAAGPYHSQSNEAWFFHVPGLKIVYPSNPKDAKGLLLAAFEDPNPVLYFEHKALYRSLSDEVPDSEYTIEIGSARTIGSGGDISFIAYGMAVKWCEDLIKEMGIDATLVDLRTLIPWDKDAVRNAVNRTGKVVVVHEDTLSGGIGAEIASWIGEECFTMLDAPVMRVGSLDTPVPFNAQLEGEFLGSRRLIETVQRLLSW